MDTNGGIAGPCRGTELIEAIQAALAEHPDARFEGNELGNVVATVDGDFIGFIDVRDRTESRGADRWESSRPTGGALSSLLHAYRSGREMHEAADIRLFAGDKDVTARFEVTRRNDQFEVRGFFDAWSAVTGYDLGGEQRHRLPADARAMVDEPNDNEKILLIPTTYIVFRDHAAT